MLGKIADAGVIIVAAIVTICGIVLALLPWHSLPVITAASPPSVQSGDTPGEISVGIPSAKPAANPPAKPK